MRFDSELTEACLDYALYTMMSVGTYSENYVHSNREKVNTIKKR